MKKSILTLIITTSVLSAINATAADGTISFTGSIVDTACKIDTTSATQTVHLGTVIASSFSAAGATVSPTRFSISLSECPKTITSAKVKFDGATTSANHEILALTTGQTAKNVGIAIYEKDNSTLIPIGTASSAITLSATETNTLTYIAKYYATATPVGAGTANATTSFTIAYN